MSVPTDSTPAAALTSHDRVRTAIVANMTSSFSGWVAAGLTREAALEMVLANTCAGRRSLAEFKAAVGL